MLRPVRPTLAPRLMISLKHLPLLGDWHVPETEELEQLRLEFEREMPAHHPLAKKSLSLLAYDGVDDILLQHSDEVDRVSVVHLTWLGRTELPNYPAVEFDGTIEAFGEWYAHRLHAAIGR